MSYDEIVAAHTRLRDKTGMSYLDCCEAFFAANFDEQKALEILERKKENGCDLH